jgi:hypothetical protein
VAVKAAVLPFAAFPGADALLGPEMRSTGEVMGVGPDFATGLREGRAAAGRPLPMRVDGRPRAAVLTVCDRDKPAATLLAERLSDLGFRIYATAGTARAVGQMGIEVETVAKVSTAGEAEETIADLVARGPVDLIVNTPLGRGARGDGYEIRRAALGAKVPVHHHHGRGERRRAGHGRGLERRGQAAPGAAPDEPRPAWLTARDASDGPARGPLEVAVSGVEAVGSSRLLRLVAPPASTSAGLDASTWCATRTGRSCCRGPWDPGPPRRGHAVLVGAAGRRPALPRHGAWSSSGRSVAASTSRASTVRRRSCWPRDTRSRPVAGVAAALGPSLRTLVAVDAGG